MRRHIPSRSVRRARPRGAWYGTFGIANLNSTTTGAAFYLWDDVASQTFNMQGHGVHQRTLLWIQITATPVTPVRLHWYVSKFTTDGTNTVPPAAISSPIPTGVGQVLSKELMDYGLTDSWGTAATDLGARTMVRDIGVKRKVSDTDALMFVIEANLAGLDTLSIYYNSRTYMRLG